jgi:hypothetical protein
MTMPSWHGSRADIHPCPLGRRPSKNNIPMSCYSPHEGRPLVDCNSVINGKITVEGHYGKQRKCGQFKGQSQMIKKRACRAKTLYTPAEYVLSRLSLLQAMDKNSKFLANNSNKTLAQLPLQSLRAERSNLDMLNII